MTPKSVKTINLVAILSISFVSMSFVTTTPAMAALGIHFPEAGQGISWLSTGYVIPLIPLTILCGWLTSNGKLKYRTATIIGSLLALVGGVAPVFINGSFEIVFAWRLVYGAGLGFLAPLANALILNMYEGNKQAKYLGWVSLLMNAGAIIAQTLSGVLVDSFGSGPEGSGWSMHYLVYFFLIIPALFSFFIPEPERKEVVKNADGSKAKQEKMGPYVVICGLFLLTFSLAIYPVMMYLTNIFIERGIGGDTAATVAGMALSAYTIAGAAGGAVFGYSFKLFKRFIIPFGFGMMTIGLALILIADNAIVATCGTICAGFGFGHLMPAFFSLLGMHTPNSRKTMAASIATAIMRCGTLSVALYLQVVAGFVGGGLPLYNMLLIIALVVFVVSALIFVFWNPYPSAIFAPKSE